MKPTACLPLMLLLMLLLPFKEPAYGNTPPRYTLTMLPLEPTNFDQVNSVHVSGGISGTRVVGMTLVHHGWLTDARAAIWQKGRGLRLLDTTPFAPANPHLSLPSSSFLTPTALNRFGAVVGYSEYSFTGAWSGRGGNACLWPPGSTTHLAGYFPSAANALAGFPQDTDSSAVAINDHGDITGSVIFNNHDKTPNDNPPASIAGTHAFVWHRGKVRLLWPGTARGINNHGWIIGLRDLGDGEDSHIRGVLWRSGRVTLLKMHPSAVSDSGTIAGSLPVSANVTHACVWSRGRLTLLSPQNSQAEAVNNRGQIVGAIKRATLWQQGRTYDLNRCVTLPKGWVLTSAVGISDQGWIIGEGTIVPAPESKVPPRTFTFLLTPR